LADKYHTLLLIDHTFRLLESRNIPYIVTMIDPLVLDQKWHVPDYIKFLQNQVKQKIMWFDDLSFLEWSKKNNFLISENWHPLEEAHAAAAAYMLVKTR
jgi:hypothetical protein